MLMLCVGWLHGNVDCWARLGLSTCDMRLGFLQSRSWLLRYEPGAEEGSTGARSVQPGLGARAAAASG